KGLRPALCVPGPSRPKTQPFQGWNEPPPRTQGNFPRRGTTLGFVTESRWDSSSGRASHVDCAFRRLMNRPLALFPLFLAATPASALIQSSTGNQPVPDPGWPEGARAVANLPSRAGWWEGPPFGGGEWHFIYRGDGAAFEQALTNFAAIKAPMPEVVLHN